MNIHLGLGIAAGALGVLVAGLTLAGAARRAMPRFAIDRALLATEVAVGLAILSGALDLPATGGPHDGLHFVYAGVALVALPIGRAWRGLARGPRPAPLAIATVVLIAVLVRLAQTG